MRVLLSGLALVLALAGLAGCGHADRQPAASPDPQCGNEGQGSCPTYSLVIGDFCRVQVIRDYLRAGKIRLEDLPTWVDKTKRDGVAIIIDWRRSDPPDKSWDKTMGELALAVDRRGYPIDQGEVDKCRATTPKSKMEKMIGGPIAP